MKSFFFNAVKTTDITSHPSGYDREYDADDHAAFFAPFFSEAGVFAGQDSGACKVQVQNGNTLVVAAGAIYIRGRMALLDGTETITAAGDCRVAIRMNKAMEVRDFQLVAVTELTRTEDIYDLELATVAIRAVTGGYEAQVTDKRTFLSYIGQPPYYPPDTEHLPYLLWVYTMGFPMTAEQRAAVEGNPSLMEIYQGTRVVKVAQEAQRNLSTHTGDRSNPHGVTAQQVGALSPADKASTAAAQAGVDDEKWMTPAKTSGYYVHQMASAAEAQAGVDTHKWVSPAALRAATQGAIAKHAAIGDIITTRRPSLGANFALCNGALIPENTYPQVAALLPKVFDMAAPSPLPLPVRKFTAAVNGCLFYADTAAIPTVFVSVYPFNTSQATNIRATGPSDTFVYFNAFFTGGYYYLLGRTYDNQFLGFYSADAINWVPCRSGFLNFILPSLVGEDMFFIHRGFDHAYGVMISGASLRGDGTGTQISLPSKLRFTHFAHTQNTHLLGRSDGTLWRCAPPYAGFTAVRLNGGGGGILSTKKYIGAFSPTYPQRVTVYDANTLLPRGVLSLPTPAVPSEVALSEGDALLLAICRGGSTSGTPYETLYVSLNLEELMADIEEVRPAGFSVEGCIYSTDTYALVPGVQNLQMYAVFSQKRRLPQLSGDAYSFMKVSE